MIIQWLNDDTKRISNKKDPLFVHENKQGGQNSNE